ncbi:phosphate ABC transporter permease PstA [Lentisphaerota bacterium WC36G]|nr:phosphate ABC transporter permease PstA [Lentisphaerae bacterium WC36]
MKKRDLLGRKVCNAIFYSMSLLITLAICMILFSLLYTIIKNGSNALSCNFLIKPTSPFKDSGISNAILGTSAITFGATVIGVPAGIFTGIYLIEYDSQSYFSKVVRISAEALMGVPSIVVGLFVYSLVVVPTGHFSGFAASVALAIIMYPVVIKVTSDMLQMVPNATREAAIALSIPKWRMIFQIIFRMAKSGLLTGVILAIARVSGETAPLLLTSLFSDAYPTGYFSEPTASLTVAINENATNSPFEYMLEKAWGAALVITIAILILNISCQLINKFTAQVKK